MARTNKRHREQTDDAYRAIGRYIVGFSQLVSEMRYLIGISLTDGVLRPRVDIAIGEGDGRDDLALVLRPLPRHSRLHRRGA